MPPWQGFAVFSLILIVLVAVVLYRIWWLNCRSSSCAASQDGEARADYAVLVASSLTIWLAGVYALATVGFAVGVQPGGATLVLAFVSAAIVQYVLMPKPTACQVPRAWINTQVVTLLLIVALVGLAGLFYDLSWDGQYYHQEAVLQINDGWNPIQDSGSANMVWVQHYPKASWYQGAAILAVTDRIETGKAPNLILIAASYLISLVAVLFAFPALRQVAPLIAGILAFNPVAAVQWSTYYVDGPLSSAIVILVACAAVAYFRPRLWAVCLATALAAAVLMTGMKFTGLVYALMLFAALVPVFWLGSPSSRSRRLGVVFSALVLVAAITIVGFNPYVTNTLEKGHPFYPIEGRGSIDVISSQVDADLLDRPWPSRFLLSHFSASGDVPEVKVPLVVSWGEVAAFGGADTRHGGFGPLFGAGFIVSLLCIPAVGEVFRLAPRSHQMAAAWAVGMLLFSIVVNPAAWWARFAPQVWLIPTVMAVIALDYAYRNRATATRWTAGVAGAALMILSVNAGIVLGANALSQAIGSEQVPHVLDTLRSLEQAGITLEVDPEGHLAGLRRLDEAQVPYDVACLAEDAGEDLPSTLIRIQLVR